MELLENPEDRGYPIDYLLARIKGRRGQLIRDWRPLIFGAYPQDALSSPQYRGFTGAKSPEVVWRRLVQEYRWVYVQMNSGLRRIFQPFFLYTELRTLVICLRQVQEKSAGRTSELLGASLLSKELKTVLSRSEDLSAVVGDLERIFSTLSPEFGGLKEALEAEGLRGVEQRLATTYLKQVMGTGLDPLLREVFSRIIDSRNILGLYKYQRMNSKAAPLFIPGGGIAVARLREIVKKDEPHALAELLRQFTGIKVDRPDPALAESSLYKSITRFLRKAGKHPFGIGLIMDYLWRCSIEAMNLSIVFYGKDLERDAIMAELVS